MEERIQEIIQKVLEWYKKNHYSQGDNYDVRITKKGKWAVRHSNDYPMQHGYGKEVVLTEDEFLEAMQNS